MSWLEDTHDLPKKGNLLSSMQLVIYMKNRLVVTISPLYDAVYRIDEGRRRE